MTELDKYYIFYVFFNSFFVFLRFYKDSIVLFPKEKRFQTNQASPYKLKRCSKKQMLQTM